MDDGACKKRVGIEDMGHSLCIEGHWNGGRGSWRRCQTGDPTSERGEVQRNTRGENGRCSLTKRILIFLPVVVIADGLCGVVYGVGVSPKALVFEWYTTYRTRFERKGPLPVQGLPGRQQKAGRARQEAGPEGRLKARAMVRWQMMAVGRNVRRTPTLPAQQSTAGTMPSVGALGLC